jgi:hypothetical protein
MFANGMLMTCQNQLVSKERMPVAGKMLCLSRVVCTVNVGEKVASKKGNQRHDAYVTIFKRACTSIECHGCFWRQPDNLNHFKVNRSLALRNMGDRQNVCLSPAMTISPANQIALVVS